MDTEEQEPCKTERLPNCENAIVEQEKVINYLLNQKHPYGAGKARFFADRGFCIGQWKLLRDALNEHGCRHEVVTEYETGFGPRCSVEGELNTPDGHCPNIRSVWQMDKGASAPRLITAYPLETKL
ncbi:MAG TPA: hypothetical protein ENN29_03700 [Candidatus Hydrogenedentes bacterium]|nr:hypothetical protein [Candidatus Hydrogenedentota bacterium]